MRPLPSTPSRRPPRSVQHRRREEADDPSGRTRRIVTLHRPASASPSRPSRRPPSPPPPPSGLNLNWGGLMGGSSALPNEKKRPRTPPDPPKILSPDQGSADTSSGDSSFSPSPDEDEEGEEEVPSEAKRPRMTSESPPSWRRPDRSFDEMTVWRVQERPRSRSGRRGRRQRRSRGQGSFSSTTMRTERPLPDANRRPRMRPHDAHDAHGGRQKAGRGNGEREWRGRDRGEQSRLEERREQRRWNDGVGMRRSSDDFRGYVDTRCNNEDGHRGFGHRREPWSRSHRGGGGGGGDYRRESDWDWERQNCGGRSRSPDRSRQRTNASRWPNRGGSWEARWRRDQDQSPSPRLRSLPPGDRGGRARENHVRSGRRREANPPRASRQRDKDEDVEDEEKQRGRRREKDVAEESSKKRRGRVDKTRKMDGGKVERMVESILVEMIHSIGKDDSKEEATGGRSASDVPASHNSIEVIIDGVARPSDQGKRNRSDGEGGDYLVMNASQDEEGLLGLENEEEKTSSQESSAKSRSVGGKGRSDSESLSVLLEHGVPASAFKHEGGFSKMSLTFCGRLMKVLYLPLEEAKRVAAGMIRAWQNCGENYFTLKERYLHARKGYKSEGAPAGSRIPPMMDLREKLHHILRTREKRRKAFRFSELVDLTMYYFNHVDGRSRDRAEGSSLESKEKKFESAKVVRGRDDHFRRSN